MNPTNKMRPIHPGEILREEFLGPLGISAHALAMNLKVPAPRINEIVHERRSVTPDTALRLARYFGTSPLEDRRDVSDYAVILSRNL